MELTYDGVGMDIGETIERGSFDSTRGAVSASVASSSSGVLDSDDEEEFTRPTKKSKKSHRSSRSLTLTSPKIVPSPLRQSSTALKIMQELGTPKAKDSPTLDELTLPPSAVAPSSSSNSNASANQSHRHKKPFRLPTTSKMEQERMKLPIYAGQFDTGTETMDIGSARKALFGALYV